MILELEIRLSFPLGVEDLWGISGSYKAGEIKLIFLKKASHQPFETCISVHSQEDIAIFLATRADCSEKELLRARKSS